MFANPIKISNMKRKILTLIMLFASVVVFGQTPRHLRVLNYVPDSCYSLTLVNLDTMARIIELESLHRENVLKPLYDSLKFSKKLVQSWIKRDSKLGVDFTASAAYVDSRYVLLPLNNERNFEKTLRSLDKSLPPFETMTDPVGQKIRCMTLTENGMGAAVFCTEDVACFAMLADMNAIYSSPVFNAELDTFDTEAQYDVVMNYTEAPMQVWTRLNQSHFAESALAANMMAKGWTSYTAYKYGNPLVNTYIAALQLYFPASVDLKNALNQLDIEIFAKAEARHDRITANSEFHIHNQQPEKQTLTFSPAELKKLIPYIPGDYMALVVSTMEGYGNLIEPYMGKFPQWRELCPLMNKPFVFTMSSLQDDNMQLLTLVDHPEQVCGILERYVEISNHITDSTFKARKNMVIEEVVEEPYIKEEDVQGEPEPMPEKPAEPVDVEFDTIEMFGESFASAVDSEDTTINMKTLRYKKIDGWDAYIIVTNKKEMDYETFTQIVKEDSACVLVKDNLLFYTTSLGALPSLSQPMEREWEKEYFEHPFFARVDFGTFVTMFGPEAAMPIRDMTCFVEDNTLTMNVSVVPGLRHGILYEIVKYVADLLKDFD